MASRQDLIAALVDWGRADNFQTRVALGAAALTIDRKAGGFLVDCAIGLVDEVHRTKENELRCDELRALALNIADIMDSDPGRIVRPRAQAIPERRDLDG